MWLWLWLGCAPVESAVVVDDAPVDTTPAETAPTDTVPVLVLCDADLDGFGLNGSGCLVVDLVDCDDADAAIFPGADDVCDGVDQDCSGAADDAFDLDGDGQAGCAGDCDDADPLRREGVPERCDGIDNNCDRVVDEGFDADGDGATTCRGDCDDADPTVHFGEPEACDGVDNDCDVWTSEEGDLDQDGVTRCGGDCDDIDPTVFPGNVEICDLRDNDCDGRGDQDPACFGCADVAGGLLCGTAVDWYTARDACQDFGMILAMPQAEAFNDVLAALAAPYGQMWIGLNDDAVEGVFVWVDGAPLTFSRWWFGEPNNAGGENCAGTNFGDLGYWNDYNCGTSLPFACQVL